MKSLFIIVITLILSSPVHPSTEGSIMMTDNGLQAIVLLDELDHPWGVSSLPDGRFLVTERSGDVVLFDPANGNQITKLKGEPEVSADGQGGLLDVLVDPDFKNNAWVYFSYSLENDVGETGTEVARARLQNNRLSDFQVLFTQLPKSWGTRHFGSRLLIDQSRYLYVTLGDRGDRDQAQDLSNHIGVVLRLYPDGTVPADNPFTTVAHAKPEIYSYGHRNIQGATFHPVTGELWAHEHGPQGGDEVNVIKKGKNYGWPTITYGAEYGSGDPIGEGVKKKGMEQPLYYWDPSIAPSGMAFYQGKVYEHWQDTSSDRQHLLVGALKEQALVHLVIEAGQVIREERLFVGQLGRIRDVEVSIDGYVFLLTDENNGKLIKLLPAFDKNRSSVH